MDEPLLSVRSITTDATSFIKSRAQKLAALMKRQNERLNADPAFHDAASERMKRCHADPAFNSLHRAAMKRLHADPKFTAANRARMQLRNADPARRANQLAR